MDRNALIFGARQAEGLAHRMMVAMAPETAELTELSDPCPDKTRSDLEWDRVLSALADRCSSAMGKAEASSLPFCETRARVRQATAEAHDATSLRQSGDAIPLSSLPPIDHALDRLRIGAVLAPSELRAMAQLIMWARSARRFLTLAKRARARALRRVRDGSDARRRRRRGRSGCFDADGHARRSREPAPEGAPRRAARGARAHDVAPRGPDAALRAICSRIATSPSATGATSSRCAPTRTSASPASSTRRAAAARRSSSSRARSCRWATG